MAGVVYWHVIMTSGIVGGVWGCYKGIKILYTEAVMPEEHIERNDFLRAALSSSIGCVFGAIEGFVIGILSPYLATGFAVSMVKKKLERSLS